MLALPSLPQCLLATRRRTFPRTRQQKKMTLKQQHSITMATTTLMTRTFNGDGDGNCSLMVSMIATGSFGVGTSAGLRGGGAGPGLRGDVGLRGDAGPSPIGDAGPGHRGGVGAGHVGGVGPCIFFAHAACVCMWPPNTDIALLPASTQMLEYLCSGWRRRSNLSAPSSASLVAAYD
mmetsp:Transcript_72180/g.120205  ORF Transcript_72180/g.120205 Transcript_72180/m.120205 type:complete len:177 (+) Transcript_72180:294-824(+)